MHHLYALLLSLALTQRHAAALTPPTGPNDRRRARLEQRGLSPQPSVKMVAAPPDAELASSLARRTLLTTQKGCWAGWEVAFDPRTGRPKPLDETGRRIVHPRSNQARPRRQNQGVQKSAHRVVRGPQKPSSPPPMLMP